MSPAPYRAGRMTWLSPCAGPGVSHRSLYAAPPALPPDRIPPTHRQFLHARTPVSAPEAKVYIIGVGSDGLAGLTARARDILTSADLVLGSEPTLDLVRELGADRVVVGSDLNQELRLIEANLG